jgi:hypothetical protein
VDTLFTMYAALPEDQYPERWAHIHLLGELLDDNAVSVLDQVISTPIPPERSPETITFSTVGEEVMIRTTAIDALGRLARGGNRPALQALLKHIRHEAFSVRRAAIQEYVAVAGPNAVDDLRKQLPESDHFILDIQRLDVQRVPPPSPERTPEGKDPTDRVPPLPPVGMPIQPRVEE